MDGEGKEHTELSLHMCNLLAVYSEYDIWIKKVSSSLILVLFACKGVSSNRTE